MTLRAKKTLRSEHPTADGGKPEKSLAGAYTGKTADSAIAHLEYVLSVDGATTVLTPAYWRVRASELAAIPTLTPTQRARVARILLQISPPSGEAALPRKTA
ncbi:hypothetical protein OKW30_004657 [Paraburkholderia sp. Clong3]|uniref:hypothetical protein n=1 Tax=Paraburkholderia sp. Clong3 TaxID=2991061 RepID=UPI003D25A09F